MGISQQRDKSISLSRQESEPLNRYYKHAQLRYPDLLASPCLPATFEIAKSSSKKTQPRTEGKSEEVDDRDNLDRSQSNPSQCSSDRRPQMEDDSGNGADYNSEDELCLPATYHHDIGHRDDNWNKHKSSHNSHHHKRDVDEGTHALHQHDLGRDHNPTADYHHLPHRSTSSSDNQPTCLTILDAPPIQTK
ncbi:hypothetical protein R6Q59_009960 [Mikania micrantha]